MVEASVVPGISGGSWEISSFNSWALKKRIYFCYLVRNDDVEGLVCSDGMITFQVWLRPV